MQQGRIQVFLKKGGGPRSKRGGGVADIAQK